MTIKSNVMQQMVNGSLAQANKPAKVMDTELVLTDKQNTDRRYGDQRHQRKNEL
jgi:hypothetical protein